MITDAAKAHDRRTWSIDAQLLLAAALRHPGPLDVSRADAAMSRTAGIDWPRFVSLADDHGVLPLLHHHLATHTFDDRLVPAATLVRIRRRAERAARRNLMLANELVSLLRDFERDGMRVASLKGPILAQQLYGSVALRRIGDLDLLVAEEDLDRATVLLVRRGYQRESSLDSDAPDAMPQNINGHIRLVSTTKPACVELHYFVQPPLGRHRHNLSTVDDGLEQISFLGGSAWVMRPEDLLVYLCIHGNKHLWERIEWIGGIAELLRAGRVSNWDRVAEYGRRLAAERALRSGLHLADALFDVPIPAAELRGDRSARAAARSVAQRLTGDPGRSLHIGTRMFHWVRTDIGARNRIARIWSILFTPTALDRSAVPLPRALAPLYSLIRPARLLLRRLRQVVGRR